MRWYLTWFSRAAGEIDELFERKIPAWRWAKTETEIETQQKEAVAMQGVPGSRPV